MWDVADEQKVERLYSFPTLIQIEMAKMFRDKKKKREKFHSKKID